MPEQVMPIKAKCPGCGARAVVFQGRKGYRLHCARCGFTAFWASPLLTEAVAVGDRLCPHAPPWEACKNGKSWTRWCPLCRCRAFRYDRPEGVAA